MDYTNLEIETENLALRAIRPADAAAIFASFTAEITVFMYPKPADRISETEDFIQASIAGMENGSNLQLVIIDKATKAFVGCCGLHGIDTQDPEAGIWVAKAFHGRKYGREAVSALVAWAEGNLQFDHIRYPVDRRNVASAKIPASLRGEIRREFTCVNDSGRELDQVEYWISKRQKT